MAKIKSGTLVSGLTAVAIVIIAVLAAQASGSAPKTPLAARPSHSGAAATKSPSSKPKPPKTYPLPARSGGGKRVVYSIAGKRVWLVDRNDKVLRTYPVVAGNVAPTTGIHRVYSRRAAGIGGDGAQVEHVVLFATTRGINVGFSAAVNGSMAPPDPSKQTAAIREKRVDGAALWQLATTGATVSVIK